MPTYTTLLISTPQDFQTILRPCYAMQRFRDTNAGMVQRVDLISIHISPFLHRPYMDHLILELYTHLARQIEKCILPKWKVCVCAAV